ncbi:MAG: TRAP transporter fused permease subunit [Sphaerochaetaceae bacterium]|nr:TRAP transporter fused permease subunit [Sphaerochaetaceae bacterium]MDC7242470.1 TRAP transporter fused permease subunit [Sphaerochaetaceae bacterium]
MNQISDTRDFNKMIVKIVAITVSLFHLLNVSGIITLSTMPIRIVHLLAMLVIAFLTKSTKKEKFKTIDLAIRLFFLALSVYCGAHLLFRWEAIANSGGVTSSYDVIIGAIFMIVILEATRRSVGNVLAIICTIFLVYPFIGQYIGGILMTRHYSLSRVINMLYTTSAGVYGTPISVSANYIILFCIYGAFLSEFGCGEFLFRLSSTLTKRFCAASAKTSIIFSALLGMLSGSAAGNVAVTGSLTIPMMVKDDYSPEQAGAISAVSSTGGQMMPPIMGAAAFIMASIIGIPYASIMKAAILPSILYFLSIFVIVHLIAKKKNIQAKGEENKDTALSVLKEDWPLALPIVVLIIMMVSGYSPFKAAYISIISLLVVYVPNQIFRKKDFDTKQFFNSVGNALEKGARDTVSIAVACGAAGIISGILSLTGLSSKLAFMIVSISHGHLIIALILTMFISLILGMGLPTTAAYLVLATVIAPALVKMGAPVLTAHLFVFYFGCISTITPPVALASYVAAGIAKADLNKVGFTAFRYGIVSFILPYMFMYGPSLLMEGAVINIIITVFFSVVGVVAIAMAIVGFIKTDTNLVEKILLIACGILMIFQGTLTDLIGIIIFICLIVVSTRKAKLRRI